MALLSAVADAGLHMQFELDGRGSLQLFPDEAVITAFEFKASQSGDCNLFMPKNYKVADPTQRPAMSLRKWVSCICDQVWARGSCSCVRGCACSCGRRATAARCLQACPPSGGGATYTCRVPQGFEPMSCWRTAVALPSSSLPYERAQAQDHANSAAWGALLLEGAAGGHLMSRLQFCL